MWNLLEKYERLQGAVRALFPVGRREDGVHTVTLIVEGEQIIEATWDIEPTVKLVGKKGAVT